MFQKFLKFFIRILLLTMTLSFCYSMKFLQKDKDHQLLIDFTCATAKDELEKHPEMRTIAMVELENNFPSKFSREVLKCLPTDVAKVFVRPHTHEFKEVKLLSYTMKHSMKLPKETLVIYLADKYKLDQSFYKQFNRFYRNFPDVHHLAHHLIVSSQSQRPAINLNQFYKTFFNLALIYEQNQKVIASGFAILFYFKRRGIRKFVETFESAQQENLSQILFRDTKDLNMDQRPILIGYTNDQYVEFQKEVKNRPINKWVPYLDIVANKMNAKFFFKEIPVDFTSYEAYRSNRNRKITMHDVHMDFYLNFDSGREFDLESYNNEEWCFLAPLPDPYSITELILFLPMDKSCWMWLGITIAVSTLVWRISEGHWNFAFGAFSYFMGQAQLSVRIRTNRLTMKILLQLLIFAIFIFSNGYQSIVTSFMLEPERQKLLMTVDEVLESDLKIEHSETFELLKQDDPKYRKAVEDGRVINFTPMGHAPKKVKDLNIAYAQPCKLMKKTIRYKGDGKSWQGLYLIPEAIEGVPDDLYIRPFHPYLEIFQELMDRTFEAGLHQAWEKFFWLKWQESTFIRTLPAPANDILDLKLIAPFFLILAFGFGAGLFALFCEIFWKDFVMQLSKEYIMRKWKEIFGRRRRLNRARVRRIQVKPRRNSY